MTRTTKISSTEEFNQLKRFRAVVTHRIAKQEELLGKISRGKFKIGDVPANVLCALVKHDIKLLERTGSEFEHRASQLRQKIHEEILGCIRSIHVN